MKILVATVCLVIALAGCSGGEKSAGESSSAGKSSSEVVAQLEKTTGCQPYKKSSSEVTSEVATEQWQCNTGLFVGKDEATDFVSFYGSKGALEADLAEKTSESGGGYAVVRGGNWLFYTYSKKSLAGALDAGGTLKRTLDPAAQATSAG